MKPANFDRLARLYRPLEFLAFGRDLERARFCLLDRLADRRSILVLGEGDGRCLARLVRIAPHARIHCVDASAAMLARAVGRIHDPDTRARVTFTQADALALDLPTSRYDAVVTLFFLDCFTAEQTAALVARIAAALGPDARWLFADFAVPPRGGARLRARLWLAVLYTFFRWETGLSARVLPPSEASIADRGFAPVETRTRQGGLLRTVLFAPVAQ